MKILIKLSLIFFVSAFLAACGGVSSPSLDIDNDFWFGSAGNTTIGLGFSQTGSSISAGLAYIDSSGRARACCTLRGNLKGLNLVISDTNASGDTLTISGRFNSAGSRLTGTISAVVNGSRTNGDVDLRYESELSNQRPETLSSSGSITIAELADLLR